MEWTLGTIMFYGGIAGVAITMVAAAIAFAVLKKSGKNITVKLNEEYGRDLK